MSGVQRWECRVAINDNGRPYVDDIEYAVGRYVLHSDHEAEVARLRAEVEAYRKDAERWQFVCEQMEVENDDDEYGFWCSTVTLKSGYIYPPPSPYYETVNQAIDAAMGAHA